MRTDYKKRALVWSAGLAWPGQKPIIGITPNWVRIVSRYVNVMKVDHRYVSGVKSLYTPNVDYVCHIIYSIVWSSPHLCHSISHAVDDYEDESGHLVNVASGEPDTKKRRWSSDRERALIGVQSCLSSSLGSLLSSSLSYSSS